MTADPHKPLRDDVRLLGELLGDTVRAHRRRRRVSDRRTRARAGQERTGRQRPSFSELADVLADMSLDEALPIARAFAHFLHLANIAEQHHRVRRRRAYQRDPEAPPQRGSCEDSFARLLAGGSLAGSSARSGLRAADRAGADGAPDRGRAPPHRAEAQSHCPALATRDRPDLTIVEREELLAALRREIEGAWATSEVREQRPSPIDEVRSGLIVFEQSLWDALPRRLRGARPGAAHEHRTRTADRCRAAALRLLDRRRPRRQPARHAGRDAPRLLAVAVGGRRSVSR